MNTIFKCTVSIVVSLTLLGSSSGNSTGEILPQLSLQGQGSEHSFSGYADLLLPLNPKSGNWTLFLDGRGYASDQNIEQGTAGVGGRYLLGSDSSYPTIIGLNALWDYAQSPHDNSFDGLGFGAEILSSWFDARFNYYLPDDKQVVYSERNKVVSNCYGSIKAPFQQIEAAMEGYNVEAGVRIPKVGETRLFVGYEAYEDPFVDSDHDGFYTRLEAHLTRGVVVDLGYYEVDEIRAGDHFFGSLSLRLPLDYREGEFTQSLRQAFIREERATQERLNDPIIRNPMVFAQTERSKIATKFKASCSSGGGGSGNNGGNDNNGNNGNNNGINNGDNNFVSNNNDNNNGNNNGFPIPN